MEYIIGGIAFLLGGLIAFLVAGVIIFFIKLSLVKFLVGGFVGVLLRIIIYRMANSGERSSYSGSSTSSSHYLSEREGKRHTSSSSPISRGR